MLSHPRASFTEAGLNGARRLILHNNRLKSNSFFGIPIPAENSTKIHKSFGNLGNFRGRECCHAPASIGTDSAQLHLGLTPEAHTLASLFTPPRPIEANLARHDAPVACPEPPALAGGATAGAIAQLHRSGKSRTRTTSASCEPPALAGGGATAATGGGTLSDRTSHRRASLNGRQGALQLGDGKVPGIVGKGEARGQRLPRP